MALIFNTPIEMQNGITVTDGYGRVGVADNVDGTQLQQIVEVYVSAETFMDGKAPISIEDFIPTLASPYNRDVDGTDVLALAHANLQAMLADAGYTTTIVLGE